MSGFMNHDYVLVFDVRDADALRRLRELCDGEFAGDAITENAWEISTKLSPHEMESKIAALLGEGDRAAYYYLSDTKRIFRVDVG